MTIIILALRRSTSLLPLRHVCIAMLKQGFAWSVSFMLARHSMFACGVESDAQGTEQRWVTDLNGLRAANLICQPVLTLSESTGVLCMVCELYGGRKKTVDKADCDGRVTWPGRASILKPEVLNVQRQ